MCFIKLISFRFLFAAENKGVGTALFFIIAYTRIFFKSRKNFFVSFVQFLQLNLLKLGYRVTNAYLAFSVACLSSLTQVCELVIILIIGS